MKQLQTVFCVILVSVLTLATTTTVNAQGGGSDRIVATINDGWTFLPKGTAYAETVAFDDADWQKISLPHSWNPFDPFDDDRTYTRSIGWYRKALNLDNRFKNKKVYLYFEGANQVTHVYVNGYFAGIHKGGYTGFAFDITKYLNWKNDSSRNVVAIQVNNAHDPFIAPLNIGFASYGGIYRDAWVIATNQLHFKGINTNAAGVYINTPSVSKEQATVAIKTTVVNETGKERTFRFVNTIFDAKGNEVKSIDQTFSVAAHQELNVSVLSETIKAPRLWSPEDPYLYRVKSQLIENELVVDEVNNSMGFRWFRFDDNGFTLNGQKVFLRGTNRHQDMKGKGDALTLEDHRRDMKLIKEMGCNFVRLAHYPQTADILKLADELGLIVWEETPVVNFITIHQEFLENTQNTIREMITQGYNHPSVVMWGSTNEILLHGPDGERIGVQNDSAYMRALKVFAIKFDSTIRAEDSSRYSTVAMHISGDYKKYGLDQIAQVAGYNIYSGWYSGKTEDFGNDLDRRKRPGHIVFVSEYGAEGEIRLNTENPLRMDYTGQYQRLYHESYLRQIKQRSWLAGTAIWNQFDFSQPNIGGPAPHMNQKGMVTWDRKPKDVYYFYKANWNPEPMVYIASRDWLIRGGAKGAKSTIDVYSNAEAITLIVNGESQKSKKCDDLNKFCWQVSLKDGKNVVVATGKIKGKTYTDQVVIDYRAYDTDLSNPLSFLQPLSINVGSNAQYLDAAGNVWIEDRPYQKGSFGYLSGKARMFDRKDVIKNTDDEPMFYTYQDSIQAYRLDVPDGQYKLTLCFAEPNRIGKGDRVFDVIVNNEAVVKGMDLAATYGFAQAMKKTFVVYAKNGSGIEIRFDSKKGNPVLNGLKLEK